MRCLTVALATAAVLAALQGSEAQAPTPQPPATPPPPAGIGSGGGDEAAQELAWQTCRNATNAAMESAADQDNQSPHADLVRTIRLASTAAALCKGSPLPLGTALAKRAGALFDLGDSVQAAHSSWAALALTGALNMTHQTAVSSIAAVPGTINLAGRTRRLSELTWMARELYNYGQELTVLGQYDLGREALAASQHFTLQRWQLQSSLRGMRRATEQKSIDAAEIVRRMSDPAAKESILAPNPSYIISGNVEVVKHRGALTWGEGEGKAVKRLLPPPRSIVSDLQAHAGSGDDEEAEWDRDDGLMSTTSYFNRQAGETYGPAFPQFVPLQEPVPEGGFSGADAVQGKGPAPGTAQQLPREWQFGSTAHTTSGEFVEQEMFVAEFENVFVEGASGIIYDDSHVYLNSHSVQVPLAKDFTGDAGTGAGTARERNLVVVPTAVSLVQNKYNNYYHFVTEVVPRLFLSLQHLQGGNTQKRHKRPTTLDRPKFIVPMGPGFVGQLVDLMGIAVEDMVVYHPENTVVLANQLFLADWANAAGTAPPAPIGAGAHAPLEPAAATAEVGADGNTEGGEGANPDFATLLAQRAVDPAGVQRGDAWVLAAGAERARQGDLTEYERATLHHAEVREGGGTDFARDMVLIPPRTLLQQVRKHFAKRLIPEPKAKLRVNTKDELAAAVALEAGAAPSKPKRTRRRKKKGGVDEAPGDKPHHTFSGFTNPLLWENGTVLATPPIRTVLILRRKEGYPRAIANSEALRSDVASFFQQAVTAEWGEGGIVAEVTAKQVAAITALTTPKAWKALHAGYAKTAAVSGATYSRAWFAQSKAEARNRTLSNAMAAAVAGSGEVEGRDFAPLSVVAKKVHVVEVDPADLSLTDALRLFQHADVVIGAHGAGLANTMFAPPTTSVVELALYEGGFRHYAAICAAMGQDYWAALAPFNATFTAPLTTDHAVVAADRAFEQQDLQDQLWNLIVDDPAPLRPSTYDTTLTVDTARLRATLAAVLAKRARGNAANAQLASTAHLELTKRGLLPSKAE